MTVFANRYAAVTERIACAAQQAGRAPEEVRLLAVTKTFPVEVMREALAAGAREFGENRPQELAQKAQVLGFQSSARLSVGEVDAAAALTPRWVQIGNLQRNKAKLVATYAAEFQALDSLRLAQSLSRLRGETGQKLQVLIEVNTSGEAAKHGVAPTAALGLAEQVLELPWLQLRGFMTVAARIDLVGEDTVRRSFAQLRQLRDQAVAQLSTQVSELSMGMSQDFVLAISQGATCVRVGSALFGERDVSP